MRVDEWIDLGLGYVLSYCKARDIVSEILASERMSPCQKVWYKA
jgi:hypothetical protein